MSASLFAPPRLDRSQEWESRKLRSLLRPRSERNRADLPLLSVARERGVFVRSAEDANHNTIPEDLSNYKVARRGDLVINKMKSWQGSLGLAPVDGIVSPAYFVFEAGIAVPQFGHHLLRSKPYVAKFGAASDGVRVGQWDLNVPRMREIELMLPEAEEQAAIVKYLAHANARIDAAIAAKRRLIALLGESIDATADELVTGVGEVRRLSTVIADGPTNGVSPSVTEDGTLETFSISAVRDGVVDVRPSDVKYVDASAVRELAKYELRAGDVLLVRGNGNLRLVGRAGLVLEAMPDRIYPDLLIRVRLTAEVDPAYVVTALNSRMVREQIEVAARTAVGTYKLSGADVRGLRLAVPPIEIQRRILGQLKDRTAAARAAMTRASSEIELLQEFRTRLVADVVTGQVDVRAIAAALPEVESASAWGDSDVPDDGEPADLDELLVDLEL